MMKKAMILSLFLVSSVAHSNELDNLLAASSEIVSQIDSGIKLAGASINYANEGGKISNGALAGSSHISTQQLNNYNTALSNMSSYQPYGSVQELLEKEAQTQLELMDGAIDTFTDVVVDMLAVQEVAEISEAAETPDDKAAVQEYVVSNQEALQIDQEEVDSYNQSLDDIETHANAASAFLGVAANEDAVDFLQQGAENNNADADFSTLSYDANEQWVKVSWQGTNNATAVYVNGQDFGLNFYKTAAEVYSDGGISELYITGPTHKGYQCFMFGLECEQ